MTGKPFQLLRRLEPPVRPTYAGDTARRVTGPIEEQSFDQMLALVADGSVRSERPVVLAFSPDEELTEEQFARLGAAADVADAHGAERALLLLDGRGLVLDVRDRTLAMELANDGDARLVAIDAAVFVPDGDAEATGGIPFPGVAAGILPRAVADQIERAYEATRTQPGSTTEHLRDPDRRRAG